MTKQELKQRYYARINRSDNKKDELKKIIQEINTLTYEGSNRQIENSLKIEILDYLRIKELTESVSIYAQSDKEYLELLTATIDTLKEN